MDSLFDQDFFILLFYHISNIKSGFSQVGYLLDQKRRLGFRQTKQQST